MAKLLLTGWKVREYVAARMPGQRGCRCAIRDSRCGRASVGTRSALRNAVVVRDSAVVSRSMLFECRVLYGRSPRMCEVLRIVDTVSCPQSFKVEVAR